MVDTAAELGRKRLFPSLTDPSYLVLRSRRIMFTKWFEQLGPGPLRVLDLGARHQPYRPLLGNRAGHYVALDINRSALITVVADGQALPFAPNSFDLVITTQVFEYFQNPHSAAQQILSVLRPGGILIASVAAFAPLYVSRERWRFLPEGIRSIFESFKDVEIVPELHDMGGLVSNINGGLSMILRPKGIRWVYRWTACPLLNILGLALEKLNLRSTDMLTSNYSIRAVKSMQS
jgi:SAM-dependent methyltransferase